MERFHHGLKEVISYHWPYYAVALGACALSSAVLTITATGSPLWYVASLGVATSAYWLVAGTLAVWYIFDLSPLTKWRWIPKVLGLRPERWGNLHVGGDEATPVLREMYPGTVGEEIDFFHPALVTEPGLLRLRKDRAPYLSQDIIRIAEWKPRGDWDCAFMIFAAHEMRTHGARVDLLHQVKQGLGPNGKIFLVEQSRDLANFLVFGPAFVHFFRRKDWLYAAEEAGFAVLREQMVTPFVRAYVLRRPGRF